MNNHIALIGNPNSGKTTLFNALTGLYQKTGNWTGVTVQEKEGFYKKDKSLKIVDLPGIYSLSVQTIDEKVVLNYLKTTSPDVIINVVDGTNLERNLFLTVELMELGVPVIIAVNMCDELQKSGATLDTERLSQAFSTPVVPVSALKNINLDKLIEVARKTLRTNVKSLLPSNAKIEDKYKLIDQIINNVITKKQTPSERFTEKADKILMHKVFGIPIFFCVIILIYFLSMKVGGFFGEYINLFFNNFAMQTSNSLFLIGAPEWLVGLTCGAVINGVGTVLSFLPQVLILFALLTLLEQSGYSSRTAFMLDRLFRTFGLSGKSLIPLGVSCGCTVTGLTATRTIESESERKMTVFLAPYMPCGAKMAVFGWFSYEFFGGNPLISASMYFLSIICVVVFGRLLKKLKPFKKQNGTFIFEIPKLRKPTLKDVIKTLWEKFKDFVAKAGSVIVIVSVLLWILENFGIKGYTYGNVEQSFLCSIGSLLKYLFYPLGFFNWQTSVAVLSGLFAKEAVVETLNIVSSNPQSLFNSKWSVLAFMSFVLLSPPCMASITTAGEELKSKKWLTFMLVFQTLSAYLVSLTINLIGIVLCSFRNLILLFICVIIVLMLILSVKTLLKGCKNCKRCIKGDKCLKNSKHNTTI